jgi:opacity protein-like surface antigen
MLIVLLGWTPANAHTYINLYSLGIKAGAAGIGDVNGNILSAGVNIEIAKLPPDLSLVMIVEIWQSHYLEHISFDGVSIRDVRDRDAAFGLMVLYKFPLKGRITPFAGFGFADHIVDSRTIWVYLGPGIGASNYRNTDTHLRLHTLLGVNYQLSSHWDGVLETKFISGDASNVNYFVAYLGLSYRFNRKLPER